jgi:putative redox protein
MVSITISYQGDLHCEAVHGPSGNTLQTDAPKDNQGKGEAFSPTDLLATSLATCVLTTMAILARRIEIDLSGAAAKIDKIMSTDGPRRVASLPLTISIPVQPSEEERQKLENAARTCPVAVSLHPDIEKSITFQWGAE